jgi:hypothetical protein
MSDTGLFSSIYEQIREYAALVDDVLVSLKDGTSSPTDPFRQKLGGLLINLANQQYSDASNRLIVLILRDAVKIDDSELAKTGKALLGKEMNKPAVETLELFAQCLEREQRRAMARIHGRLD